MVPIRILIAAVSLGLVALPVHAEEPDGIGEAAAPAPPRTISARSTAARIIETQVPRYPFTQRRLGQEGWVVLSYVIQPDGSVGDVLVDDSSGVEGFEQAALQAAAAQRFEPATVDGKAVEQCTHKVRYLFRIEGQPLGARQAFRGPYNRISDMLDKGDLAGAESSLAELRDKGAWNLYEAARIELLNADLCRRKGDKDCQLTSLRRATVPDGYYLEPKVYRQVLESIAALELGLGLYGQVLGTVEKRDQLRPRLAADHPLTIAAGQIRTALAGDQPISFAGRIAPQPQVTTGTPFWGHELLRRGFTIDQVAGRIDKVDIRCDWRRTTFDFDPAFVWQIPDSWGDCSVLVYGEDETTFKLVELPATMAANNP